MRSRLASWYASARRDLPWRRTRDAYAIAVSELMLQQTQVATVIPYYDRWLRQFPTWSALAAADEVAVLKAWEGLGYYRRARNLHALAQAVVANGGHLPQEETALLALPGIGPYTAAAIGSIAFGLPLAVLDGNVMRVLTRLWDIGDDIALTSTRLKLQALADTFLDRANPSIHNQALMELGATVCMPGEPLCLLCPFKDDCRGRTHARNLPVKTRTATIRREETIAIIRRDDLVYCEQVSSGKAWHGLWRFPDFDPARMLAGEEIGLLKYGITKYAVTMKAISATWRSETTTSRVEELSPAGRYLTLRDLEKLALAAPHRKLMARI